MTVSPTRPVIYRFRILYTLPELEKTTKITQIMLWEVQILTKTGIKDNCWTIM